MTNRDKNVTFFREFLEKNNRAKKSRSCHDVTFCHVLSRCHFLTFFLFLCVGRVFSLPGTPQECSPELSRNVPQNFPGTLPRISLESSGRDSLTSFFNGCFSKIQKTWAVRLIWRDSLTSFSTDLFQKFKKLGPSSCPGVIHSQVLVNG